MDNDLDDGQKKLYSIFSGFCLNRDIIYVGSSPGLGWCKALRDLVYEKVIYAFDPRELDQECYDLARKHARFYLRAVTKSEDVISEIGENSVFDIIWDVRCNYTNEDEHVLRIFWLSASLSGGRGRIANINAR